MSFHHHKLHATHFVVSCHSSISLANVFSSKYNNLSATNFLSLFSNNNKKKLVSLIFFSLSLSFITKETVSFILHFNLSLNLNNNLSLHLKKIEEFGVEGE